MVPMSYDNLECATNTSKIKVALINLCLTLNTGVRLNGVHNIMRGLSYLWKALGSWLEWVVQ
jgi:hypothetical protein